MNMYSCIYSFVRYVGGKQLCKLTKERLQFPMKENKQVTDYSTHFEPDIRFAIHSSYVCVFSAFLEHNQETLSLQ